MLQAFGHCRGATVQWHVSYKPGHRELQSPNHILMHYATPFCIRKLCAHTRKIPINALHVSRWFNLSVEYWTLHTLNTHSFAYVAEDGWGYQALTLDEEKKWPTTFWYTRHLSHHYLNLPSTGKWLPVLLL